MDKSSDKKTDATKPDPAEKPTTNQPANDAKVMKPGESLVDMGSRDMRVVPPRGY